MTHHLSLLEPAFKKNKSSIPTVNTSFQTQTYYSTCQANFFKVYSTQSEFLKKIQNLLQCIQRRKINKIVNQIKLSNRTFRKYFSQMRINNLKIQDIIKFQEMAQGQSANQMKRSSIGNLGMSSKVNFFSKQSKNKQVQMIKKGFMSLIQKLETLKKQDFINQTKYLQGILLRQTTKLKEYGYEFLFQYKQKNCNLMSQMENQQKTQGLYPLVMANVREETNALNKVSKSFQKMVKK